MNKQAFSSAACDCCPNCPKDCQCGCGKIEIKSVTKNGVTYLMPKGMFVK